MLCVPKPQHPTHQARLHAAAPELHALAQRLRIAFACLVELGVRPEVIRCLPLQLVDLLAAGRSELVLYLPARGLLRAVRPRTQTSAWQATDSVAWNVRLPTLARQACRCVLSGARCALARCTASLHKHAITRRWSTDAPEASNNLAALVAKEPRDVTVLLSIHLTSPGCRCGMEN